MPRRARRLSVVLVAAGLMAGCRTSPSMVKAPVRPSAPSSSGSPALPVPVAPNAPSAAPAPVIVRSGTPGLSVSTLVGGGAMATLFQPEGIAAMASGSLAIADLGTLSIWTVNASGSMTLLAGGSFGRKDGTGAAAQFWGASDVAAAPDGSLVVADGDTLRRVSASGVVTTIALDGPDGKPVPYVQIFGVAVEPSGAIDLSTLHRIDRLGTDGVVRTLAGSDQAGFADGTGNLAAFDLPERLAWDPAGYLVVADSGNNRIRRVNLDGSVTTLAGTGEAGYTDGPVGAAQFKDPAGVAVEPDGTILVADGGNEAIREIAQGKVVTLAGNGSSGMVDGPAASAQFGEVSAIAVLSGGGVAIADPDNQRIRLLE